MKKTIITLVSVTAFTGLTSAQNLLTNGGFENNAGYVNTSPTPNQYGVVASPLGWTVTSGRTTYLGSNAGGAWVMPNGTGDWAMQTDGEGSPVTMHQDFISVAATGYRLNYDYWTRSFGPLSAPITVSIIDTVTNTSIYSASYTLPTSDTMGAVSQMFTGTGNNLRLEIADKSRNNNNVAVFDSFSVTAVPEPSSGALLGLGALGLLARRER